MIKRALVIVDYQRDFVVGVFKTPGSERFDMNIAEKINIARGRGDTTIIFTKDVHTNEDSQNVERKTLPEHCVKGSGGEELFGEVGKCLNEDDDIVIEKSTFGSLELADILTENKYDEVEFCGLVTDICVISNVLIARAALPEARIIVDKFVTGSGDKEGHEAALKVMERNLVEIHDPRERNALGEDGAWN